MTREQTLERLNAQLETLDDAALAQLLGALEQNEEQRWLDVALADQRVRLERLEADLPEGEVATWLAGLREASTKVRWDSKKGELIYGG